MLKSESNVMERMKGYSCAPEVEGGRIDPFAMLSLSNFFIFPASRNHCQRASSHTAKGISYESFPAS
jgi:hypothetical protein